MREEDVIQELIRDNSKTFNVKRDPSVKLQVIDGNIDISKLVYAFPNEEWEESEMVVK